MIHGINDLDQFLHYVADWVIDSIEKEKKLTISDFGNALRIIGWLRPDWSNVYEFFLDYLM